MFYTRHKENKPYFWGVAIFLILAGAGLTAVGIAEGACNILSDTLFANIFLKVIGGLIVTSLGYIHLELELIRTK